MINYRSLGNTGISVSEISFGAWQLGNQDDWGGMSDSVAKNLVSEALDAGINLFDTAPHYANQRSETLLGEALHGCRDQVIIVSKFGHCLEGGKDFSVDALWSSLESSLRRLQSDYIDVLLLHNPEMSIYADSEPLWEELEKAKRQGKIRHYGVSLDFAHEAELCLEKTGSEVLEVLFNVFHQDIRHAFPIIGEKQTGVIVKVPLDSGWLTGKYHEDSFFQGVRNRWSNAQIEQRASLVRQLDWLTADGSTLAQKALGFLLSYQEVSCVIPGVRSSQQLRSNVAASSVRVTAEDRVRLEKFWDEQTNHGNSLLPW